MNRLDSLFARSRQEGKTAFIPFLTAGDPDLQTTAKFALAIQDRAKKRGVPIVLEIGFPYSDPIADGPTIQDSYNRALGKKLKIAEIFAMIAGLRQSFEFPIVGMVSDSLIFRRGTAKFLDAAAKAGLDGLIVPDLPIEESGELHRLGKERGLSIVQLVAPTTPPERAAKIVRETTGFVYSVSVAGITGARTQLPPDLADRLKKLRQSTDKPVCVGFGVGSPEQVRRLAPLVDGVIVGSAIVRKLENAADPAAFQAAVEFVDSLLSGLEQAKA